MIEEKKMGYADFGYPNYEATEVTVIIDTDSGIRIYQPKDCKDWFAPNEQEHFYPTVSEAAAALEDHRRELFSKMDEVKKYITAMNEWAAWIKKTDPLYFTEDDYLPYHNQSENSTTAMLRSRCDAYSKENDYLLGIIRTGFININGNTFRAEDVDYIKWGNQKAELILKNRTNVHTCNHEEFHVVKALFGDNISKCTYTRLDEEVSNKEE